MVGRPWCRSLHLLDSKHPEDLDTDQDTEAAAREDFGPELPVQIWFGSVPLILDDDKDH